MTDLAVRCDSCGTFSRVPMMAVGRMAICPECRAEFVVRAATPHSEIPTVYPIHGKPSEPSRGLLFGLALSAFLVPLTWLLAKAIGAAPPVFTLGLPLAIAFASAGLGFGVALANDWSYRTRLKAIFMLLGLAWGISATFFFLKSEWVEAIRRDLGLPGGPWVEVKANDYRVFMPGQPRKENVEIISGWTLDAQRFADRKGRTYAFCVGECKPEVAAVGKQDDQFFAAAKDGAIAASNGTLLAEKDTFLEKNPGREFIFKLPDQATNRTVRVYRVGTKAVVAMAEGVFLPPDAPEVKKFFNSLTLKTGH